MIKINLFGLNYNSLKFLLILLNIKKILYVHYIYKYIYKYKTKNIKTITNIGKKLRYDLESISIIKYMKIVFEKISKDNTIKWLYKTEENYCIETIAITNKKKVFTLCISSQVGCKLNCSFCYTATKKFYKNLKPEEIINQVNLSYKRTKILYKNNYKIINIVFMGMGEPLLNMKNIKESINILVDKNAYNLSKKKITVSTSGIIPEIKIIKECGVSLAISLHATNNKIRNELVPINKKYSLKQLIYTCKLYYKNKYITIEYILLKNINDKIIYAKQLINILKNIKYKVCLIPFNKVDTKKGYKCTNITNIINFQKFLKEKNVITTIRKSKGYNIKAACGQLSGNLNNYMNKYKNDK